MMPTMLVATTAEIEGGSLMMEGLMTTALGMIVVFIALVLLIIMLHISGRVFASSQPQKAVSEVVPAEVMQPVVEEVVSDEVAAADDMAIIAVIAAAIAAYTGRQASDIKVSSIRRLVSVETGWAAQARRDLIDVRRSLN